MKDEILRYGNINPLHAVWRLDARISDGAPQYHLVSAAFIAFVIGIDTKDSRAVRISRICPSLSAMKLRQRFPNRAPGPEISSLLLVFTVTPMTEKPGSFTKRASE